MSEVQFRAALLQTVPVLRQRRAIRVHPGGPRAHLSEGREEFLHILRIPHDGREGHRADHLRAALAGSAGSSAGAPAGCSPGLREPLQEIILPPDLASSLSRALFVSSAPPRTLCWSKRFVLEVFRPCLPSCDMAV